MVVFGQYASDDMLINLDTKSFRDDQGNPRAAEAPIAAFELDNGANEWFGWPLRSWLRSSPGVVCQIISPPISQSISESSTSHFPH
jgi:hypothetical protein